MIRPNIRQLLLLVASASVVVGLTACGGDDDDDADNGNGGNGGNVATATQSNSGNGGTDNGEAVEVEIVAKDNMYEPKEITVPVGKTVKIELKNEGLAIHNMTIPNTAFKSDAVVNAGKTSEFEAKFDKAGTYDFQCDYHVPDMVGKIIVK